ncbi:NADPH oxidase 5 [Tachyglossus aculeatus]|uniref:NADPH oxidase 5 n=1 Tax=Tachyglossus aculeatus TaxID=9261 RepID=UPI0018F3F571|nr:NADPH oxidase 5 [Tachyglossus aculeatus]
MGAEDDAKWLEWVTRQFEAIAGEDKQIDLEEFKMALKVKESFFAERFFALFDSDGSGTITLDELLESLNLLIHGSPMDKLRFLFRVYDVDGSGSIDPDELQTVLRSCLRESEISLPEDKLDDLTLALFESADRDQSGSITFEELRGELENIPEVMENLTISAAHWLKPPTSRKQRQSRPRLLTPAYWHNNRGTLFILACYVGLNVTLFTLAALAHAGHGASIMVAKGCGQCLNFNCTFTVVLMLRRCLTWLRTTRLARVFPLDQNVEFHQLVGYVVAGLSLVHTAAHLINFVALSGHGPFRLWEYLLTTRPGIGWVHGSAALTGIILQLLVVVMLVCSSSFVRQSGRFEVFYWTHLSYVGIWALLIMHGPNFWKWFLGPGALFLLEKLVGLLVSHRASFSIVEVHLLSSKVTHLVIKRPPFFHYKPGDYVYVNIPVIAKYEWHPFTLSSAPEQLDTMWIHVRSQGQWTNRLYEYFRGSKPCGLEPKRLTSSLRLRRSQRAARHPAPLSENHQFCNVKCYVDGPYGTPTRRIFTSEHAVLIGAGIGITPFASILQSIMYRYQMRKENCPNCKFSWCETVRDDEMKLRKVDFIWINRDQKSFEWFVSLLTKLEMDQGQNQAAGNFLELHLYMTSALGKNDMKAIGLQMALDLLAKKEKKDSITGLQARTQPGRPDWSQVFQKVAAENKGKVQVFFCGSPALAKVIKAQCEQLNFKFFKENF